MSVTIKKNQLPNFEKELSKRIYGVFGVTKKTSSREDNAEINNAQIGANAYYGIKQPIRDPFLKPAMLRQGQINSNAFKSIQNRLPTKENILTAVLIELKNNSIEAITTKGFGEWAPNSPKTIAMKNGKDTPLIDSTSFIRSIDFDIRQKD